jgi:hypothetical protein
MVIDLQLPKTNTTPNIYCDFVHFITKNWSGQMNIYIKQQKQTFSIYIIRGKRLLGLKGNRGGYMMKQAMNVHGLPDLNSS